MIGFVVSQIMTVSLVNQWLSPFFTDSASYGLNSYTEEVAFYQDMGFGCPFLIGTTSPVQSWHLPFSGLCCHDVNFANVLSDSLNETLQICSSRLRMKSRPSVKSTSMGGSPRPKHSVKSTKASRFQVPSFRMSR
jgi:hypothetical protein